MPTSARILARPYPARACRVVPVEEPLPRWLLWAAVLAVLVGLACLYLDFNEQALAGIVRLWRG